ncbi:MAG: hypothetical protein A2Y25_06960 [Candidatus Melainabacteria bacterium GWF2_37_15]|nr:MAG: hypothetical protein A2Y25_06960 [Candidatus Melainabacteria bacterium GWF2_37_15]
MQQVSNQLSFTACSPKSYRRAANKIIYALKQIKPGSPNYSGQPRERLLNAIKKRPHRLIKIEDTRLYIQLIGLHSKYEHGLNIRI